MPDSDETHAAAGMGMFSRHDITNAEAVTEAMDQRGGVPADLVVMRGESESTADRKGGPASGAAPRAGADAREESRVPGENERHEDGEVDLGTAMALLVSLRDAVLDLKVLQQEQAHKTERVHEQQQLMFEKMERLAESTDTKLEEQADAWQVCRQKSPREDPYKTLQ